MRVLCTFMLFPFAAFIAWLAGYNFDSRNFAVAWTFFVTVVFAGLVYIFPGWEK